MGAPISGSIGSRASRCLWGAEEAGVDFAWQPINTFDGSNRSAEYLAINPSGKIPPMQDGDIVLTEVKAINPYLAASHGGCSLWASDCRSRWRVRQRTFWSAT